MQDASLRRKICIPDGLTSNVATLRHGSLVLQEQLCLFLEEIVPSLPKPSTPKLSMRRWLLSITTAQVTLVTSFSFVRSLRHVVALYVHK